MAKARSGRVLSPMSAEEARTLGIAVQERAGFFWTGPGGKSNMAPKTDAKTWFKLRDQGLGNGTGLCGATGEDRVAVVTAWSPPKSAGQLDPDCVTKLGVVLERGPWRPAWITRHRQDWTGRAVAEAFGIDQAQGSWMEEAKALLQRLEAAGFLGTEKVRDANRNSVTVSVFVGGAGEDAEQADSAE